MRSLWKGALSLENLKKLKPQKTDYIPLFECIDAQQLSAILLNNHYYLKLPQKFIDVFLPLLKKIGRTKASCVYTGKGNSHWVIPSTWLGFGMPK